jgi:hypothetical protein
MTQTRFAERLPFRVVTIDRERVAPDVRRDDQRAVTVEADREEARLAQLEFAELNPGRRFVGAPEYARCKRLFIGDRSAHRAFAIDDPAVDVAGLAIRQKRFPRRFGIESVEVRIAAGIVRVDQNVVGTITQHRIERSRVQLDDIRPIGIDRGQWRAASVLQRFVQYSASQDQTLVVDPCESYDVTALRRRDDAARHAIEVDHRKTDLALHRHQRADVFAGRLKLERAVVGVLEKRFRRHGLGVVGSD